MEEFKDDEGVKLVDEYAELNAQKKEIEKRLDDLKERLVAFSRQKGLDMVYGSNLKASISEYAKVVFPEDKTGLTELIKARGLYEELSMLNYPGLRSRIVKGEIHKDIASLAKIEKEYRVGITKKRK